MSLVCKPQNSSRSCARDDGDLAERVFAIDVGKLTAASDGRMTFFEHVVAKGAIHQHTDNFRIGSEGSSVGMIGTHHHFPRVVNHQIPVKTDTPLQRMNQTFVAIFDWSNTATRFHFCVTTEPFASVHIGQKIAKWPISGHASRFPEHYLTDINRKIVMFIDIVGQRSNFGVECVFISLATPVTVELNVCKMAPVTLECFHGIKGRLPVAGHAQIIAMDMDRMGQSESVPCSGNTANNLSWCDRKMINLSIEPRYIAALVMFPNLDSTGIHQLRRISFGRPK